MRSLLFALALIPSAAFGAGPHYDGGLTFDGGTLSLDLTLSSGTQLFLPTGGTAADPTLA